MSFEGCNIHINDECELAIRRALLCSILWMLVNIIIFSNELWWLSIALLSSASVMWVSGYQNHFPREFPTDQKCLWGLPELLHFQDVIFFFSKAYIPEKGMALGQKSCILLTALCLSVLCVTLEKWPSFCSAGHKKGQWLQAEVLGCWNANRTLPQETLRPAQPAKVPVLCCSKEKMTYSSLDIKCFYK